MCVCVCVFEFACQFVRICQSMRACGWVGVHVNGDRSFSSHMSVPYLHLLAPVWLIQAQIHARACAHAHTNTHPHTHTDTETDTHTFTYVHTCLFRTCTYWLLSGAMSAQSREGGNTHTHAHSHTHTRKHARTHARTHTHTRMHLLAPVWRHEFPKP